MFDDVLDVLWCSMKFSDVLWCSMSSEHSWFPFVWTYLRSFSGHFLSMFWSTPAFKRGVGPGIEGKRSLLNICSRTLGSNGNSGGIGGGGVLARSPHISLGSSGTLPAGYLTRNTSHRWEAVMRFAPIRYHFRINYLPSHSILPCYTGKKCRA